MIKKKATRGKYQFVAAHSATQHLTLTPPGGSPEINIQPMGLESHGGYFDKLVAAGTKRKVVLEELVTNTTTLTTRN